MTATEALAKALETNWWGLNGHIGQEAADKLRTALHSEGYTIVQDSELGALRSVTEQAAGMGSCSQTHHEWIERAARAALGSVSGSTE